MFACDLISCVTGDNRALTRLWGMLLYQGLQFVIVSIIVIDITLMIILGIEFSLAIIKTRKGEFHN